jgi:hypothetical protein
MSLLLSERLGEQLPQIAHRPPGVASLDAAEDAIELADAYGVCDGNPLAESQKITLRNAMGERADGSWAATQVADFGPRQGTGKNDKIAARELAGLVLHGEKLIIHTAHELATAKESFKRLEAVFENHDDLRRKVLRFRYSNEVQGIEMRNGARLIYKARSGSGQRGFAKADLIVYDEAQHMAREHLAASAPSKLANPNSQTWYAGSGGLSTSSVAWAMRRAALRGDAGRLAYTEATAELVKLIGGKVQSERPDPADRDAWYRAMPGLGRWVTEESMESILDELGTELFARECLCVWDPEAGVAEGLIPQATWDLVNEPTPRPSGAVVLVPDVNAERSASTVVAVGAGVDEKGKPAVVVEVVEHRPGTGWLVGRCKELEERHGAAWAVDGSKKAPIAALVPDLVESGLNPQPIGADMAAACGAMFDAIVDRTVVFRRHPSMDAAIAGLVRKTSGEWDRLQGVDISPFVAATIGLWVESQGAGEPLVMMVGGTT